MLKFLAYAREKAYFCTIFYADVNRRFLSICFLAAIVGMVMASVTTPMAHTRGRMNRDSVASDSLMLDSVALDSVSTDTLRYLIVGGDTVYLGVGGHTGVDTVAIDCTLTGLSPPMGQSPTWFSEDFLRW